MNKILALIVVFIGVTLLSAPALSGLPEPKNEIEKRNLKTLSLFISEVWGKGHFARLPDLLAPKYIRHHAQQTKISTAESYAKDNAGVTAQLVTNDAMIDGNRLWLRWSGTMAGPEGKQILMKGLQVYRFEDGKIAETWALSESNGVWPDN